MDIFSHAIVGAATGALFGHPIAGAIAATLPDLVLGIKRKYAPTEWYDLTHSPIPTSLLLYGPATSFTLDWQLGVCLVLCYWSHIFLDVFTHGENWAPKLFAPISHKRYSFGDDWEWFNSSWRKGLALSIGWFATCALLATIW
jgi:membrane-bound metal-dependent hydrolase YbcI (DUF457 family)